MTLCCVWKIYYISSILHSRVRRAAFSSLMNNSRERSPLTLTFHQRFIYSLHMPRVLGGFHPRLSSRRSENETLNSWWKRLERCNKKLPRRKRSLLQGASCIIRDFLVSRGVLIKPAICSLVSKATQLTPRQRSTFCQTLNTWYSSELATRRCSLEWI